ncbi:MAG: glycosyltransferase [Acidimicrobiia bacterium]
MGLPLRPGTAAHVVAVVVHRDPPPERWNAVLAALAAQESVPLWVVVVDIGGGDTPLPSVRRWLADARVVRLEGVSNRATAVNRVVGAMPPGTRPGYLLVCHDDAAPEPGAVRALLDAALEWDADVVGPKLVGWDDERRLVDVGRAVDRLGVSLPYVERGEIDQGQHDGLREVFTTPGGCVLVRTGLFTAIGGFDEAIDGPEEELSLCWRARAAGARVLVTTAARVRHAEVPGDPGQRERLAARHRLRIVLTCYGILGVLRALPRAVGVTMAGTLGALATGRLRRAMAGLGAWTWNARHLPSLVGVRWRMRRARRVPDRQIRRLQVPGIVGPRMRLRRLERGAVAAAVRPQADPPRAEAGHGWSPASTLVALGLAAVMLFGSRHLLTNGVPAVGELVPFGDPPGDPAGDPVTWLAGGRDLGFGPVGAVPTGLGLLGGVAALAGHAAEAVRAVVTVGLLPLGVVGAYRLLGPSGSRAAQLAAAAAYAALPLPYDALAAGRWSSLAAYAAAPWLLGRLARASGLAPFGPRPGDPTGGEPGGGTEPVAAVSDVPETTAHPTWRHVVATGAVAGVAGLLVPQAPALLAGTGLALVAGSLLAGRLRGVGRMVLASAGGAVLGAALHLPAALEIAGSRAAVLAWLGREPPPDGGPGPLDLLRFQVDDAGGAPLGFALLGAAALPLLVARGWRLAWAIRGWTVAVAGWALLWARGEGWAPWPSPPPGVVLAPAAAGLVLAVGLGVAAVGADVRGRSRRLGVRWTLSGCALLALAGATLPTLSAAMDGWWGMPRGDFTEVLAPVDEATGATPGRVLWLGHPGVLPGGRGWPLGDGLDYALSSGGSRGLAELWPGPEPPKAARVAGALDLAVTRQTSRLGRLLAPSGVAFVVMPLRAAPMPFAAEERPVPDDMQAALAEQLDLALTDTDPAVLVYRNTAYVPDPAAADPDPAAAGAPAGDGGPVPWMAVAAQGALWLLVVVVVVRMRVGRVPAPATVAPPLGSSVASPATGRAASPITVHAEPARASAGVPGGADGDAGDRGRGGGTGDNARGSDGVDRAGGDGGSGDGAAEAAEPRAPTDGRVRS